MVHNVVAEISLPSVRDALHGSYTKSNVAAAGNNNKNTSSSSAVVPLTYPVGRGTLQVTGAYISLRDVNNNNNNNNNNNSGSSSCDDVVVLIRAHVKGMLDAEARVFTVAAVKLGGNPTQQQPPHTSSLSSTSTSSCMLKKGETLPRTVFVRLDMRLQMERVSFSLVVLPAGKSKGNDCALAVTVFGVVSALLPA